MTSHSTLSALKAGLLSGVSALALVSTSAAHADTVLRYSDHQPLDGMRTHFLDEVFFPAVEKESDGRIRIERHWNGEVAIAYEALSTVSKGEKDDISTVVPEYTAKELPVHQLLKSFPKGPSGDAQVQFFRDLYEAVPQYREELAANNLVPIFLSTGYPSGFFSASPLASLADIKGQRWRSASFWHLDFLKNAGAEPVKTHWGPEIYTSLENGQLNGILVNIDSAYDLKLHEKAPYALVSKQLWLGHLYIVAMNKPRYEALSAEDKAAISRAAVTSYRKLGAYMDEHYQSMVSLLEKEGTKVRELSPEEVDTFAQQSQYPTVQRQWVESQQAAGVKGVTQAYQATSRLLGL